MDARTAYLAAPLLTLAYGVIRIVDGFDGSRGPGIAWTTGHLAFMAAVVLFIVIFRDMWRRLRPSRLATATMAAGFAGLACVFAQFAIDVAVGFMAADHDAMGRLFDHVQAVPGVRLAVYDAGPYLFYVAQLALVVHLAVRREVKVWTPVLMLAGQLAPLVALDLIPIGAIFQLLAFWPLARRDAVAARHALGRV